MTFTIRDLFWLIALVGMLLANTLHLNQVERNYRISRDYVSAVANGYVKDYADIHGWGDLEMEAIDDNRRDQTPATAHDSTRWWYREVARKTLEQLK